MSLKKVSTPVETKSTFPGENGNKKKVQVIASLKPFIIKWNVYENYNSTYLHVFIGLLTLTAIWKIIYRKKLK
jgi:hypothetical protein